MTSVSINRPGEGRGLGKLAQIDWGLVGLLCLIAAVGAVMLYSVGGASMTPWAGNHIVRFTIFLAMTLVLALVDIRVWFALSYPVYVVAILLLVAVEVVGDTRMGAQRWLSIGSFSFQPSEIMKVGIVMALARFYHGLSAEDARWSWKLLIPAVMIALPVALVAHQPDLGTSLLILFTGAAIMFIAGLSWTVIAALAAAAAVAVPVMYMFVLHEYQRTRIDILLNPGSDPSGAGYHVTQGKIALGSGGFLGAGFGLGSQSQRDFLPEKHTDFIYASLGEEFGFIGAFGILVVYGLAIAA
ncbi:MAG TPA: FtsW/RodA/SpoVE family cell cycle protein, partial [Lautropia sp.]|nr:FtsW/RodA/SpoVE family cell cycle protein [Lautropia sp.]